jgi:hypothetical protein
MPKKAVKPRQKKELIQDWKIQFLETGEQPEGVDFWEFTDLGWVDWRQEKLWSEVKDHVVSQWKAAKPCTRPWAWYKFDAPRQNDEFFGHYYHGTLPEQRLKVGGSGHVCEYNFVPAYNFGVFKYWHYNENDPPLFESQAAYLHRLGLLSETEEKYFEEHPDLAEPENIQDIMPGHQPQVVLKS